MTRDMEMDCCNTTFKTIGTSTFTEKNLFGQENYFKQNNRTV